jgi:DNA-binding transcriptional MerR regulator
MYSRVELAKLCNCKERAIQYREERGYLKPAGTPGRGTYYYAQDVEEFLKNSKERRKGRRTKS